MDKEKIIEQCIDEDTESTKTGYTIKSKITVGKKMDWDTHCHICHCSGCACDEETLKQNPLPKEKIYICYLRSKTMDEILSIHRTEAAAIAKRKQVLDALGNWGPIMLWVNIIERELDD